MTLKRKLGHHGLFSPMGSTDGWIHKPWSLSQTRRALRPALWSGNMPKVGNYNSQKPAKPKPVEDLLYVHIIIYHKV